MLRNVTKKDKLEIEVRVYTLYICRYTEVNEMAKDAVDKKIAELYATKVTVNLESKSTLTPEDFWSSMQIISCNNKAVMNLCLR